MLHRRLLLRRRLLLMLLHCSHVSRVLIRLRIDRVWCSAQIVRRRLMWHLSLGYADIAMEHHVRCCVRRLAICCKWSPGKRIEAMDEYASSGSGEVCVHLLWCGHTVRAGVLWLLRHRLHAARLRPIREHVPGRLHRIARQGAGGMWKGVGYRLEVVGVRVRRRHVRRQLALHFRTLRLLLPTVMSAQNTM